MTKSDGTLGYDRLYKEFDSPLTKKVRAAAYARDIGQHSWVSAEELEAIGPRLGLSSASRILDLGCGPGGPLTFLAQETGCHGVGIDLSDAAVEAGGVRSLALGLRDQVSFQQGDLNQPLPFQDHSFDAVMSLDVILHLSDRRKLFGDVARVLKPGGMFFFTDAGVVTGTLSDEERRRRALTAPLQFVAADFNTNALVQAGFRLIDHHDSTGNVVTVVSGRLSARARHENELRAREGESEFARQQLYLQTVADLSRRRALSRISYLAQAGADPAD